MNSWVKESNMIDYKLVDNEYADALFLLRKGETLTLNKLKDEFVYSDILIQRMRQDSDIRIIKNRIEYIRAHHQPHIPIKKIDPELKIALDDVLYRLKYNNRMSVDQVKALFPQSPDSLIDALNKSHKTKYLNGYYYKVF